MKHMKKILLTSAAVAAMGLGMPSGAQAFDDTNWVWNVMAAKDISEDVNVSVDINPTGMATVENLQENIGNVNATATLSNFANNPPGIGEGGTVTLDETVTVTSNFNKPVGVGNSVPDSGGNVNDDGDSPLTFTYLNGTLGEQANGYTTINDINIQGEIALEDIEGVNDAIDLPKVENTATAVANNYSMESSVAANVNSAQLNYGGFNVPELESEGSNPIVDQQEYLGATYGSVGNAHVGKAYTAGLAAALGIITQGDVTATATIDNGELDGAAIQNASVENSATAVGNNFSVDLAAITPDDAFLVADNVQFNYANTTATATVDGVSIDNYAGFGAAGFGNCGGCLEGIDSVQTAIVKNVATAVGNNASIKISSPDIGNGL